MQTRTEAFFLAASPGRSGQRFCIFHAAHGPKPKGCILYIHPFAEEMNKSRRMAALQSRALSQAGYAVLQIDLLGCGDSSGDFGDAGWEDWVKDVEQAARWLLQRVNAPLWLWGLRAGCLLATQAAVRLDQACNFLFWAPALSGKNLLQQFLRLKVAGDMLQGKSTGAAETPQAQLANGESVEVAGYSLSPSLASGLQDAQLAPVQTSGDAGRVEWFELSTRDDAVQSPASTKAVARWTEAGFRVRSHIENGPSFWQTSEIEEAAALVSATVAALDPATPSVTA